MSFNIISNDEKNNHYDWLVKFAVQADTIVLVSPFLSLNIGKLLVQMPTIKKIILYSNLDGFGMASATIRAIHNLYVYCQDRIEIKVYCNDNLHGKVYLFYRGDEAKGFLVSSANFTDKGLKSNQEYGIFSDNKDIQEDLLKRIKANHYDEITLDKVICIENGVKDFERTNGVKKVPVFKAKMYLEKKEQQRMETRYFLKLLGTVERPYEIQRNLKEDNPIGISEESYKRYRERLPKKGDIFICHGVGKGRACIVGYCRLTTDEPSKETRYEGDKWSYKYYIEDLNEEYSCHWYEHCSSMKTFQLQDEFVKKMPNQKVTLTGNSLGAIQLGQGLIELSKEFALFLIDRINEKTK